MKQLYLLIIALLTAISIMAQKEMPIIAYWGIPDTMSTDQSFKDFRDCGFSVSIYPYSSLDLLLKACSVASRHGVDIIAECPQMKDAPTRTARTLRNTKGFLGYMIQDEPSLPDMQKRQKEIERIKTIDQSHLMYVNLLPYYRQDWFQAAAKTTSFEEYVEAGANLSCQQISFDFYPITTDVGIRPTWYKNLETVRRQSLKTGKPFWGFALSVPHAVYPQPTIGSLRLQVYSNLAYGAQAIQYFTYWTPRPTKDWDFHDAPISQDGQKTKTYELVRQMNNELKPIASLFYEGRVTAVHHLGDIPEGTTRQTAMPVNLRSLKTVGRQGAIVSQLEKDGHQYLAIVNKSHEEPLTIRIRTRNTTPRHLSKTLQEASVRNSYTISGGDMLLFRLK